MLPEYSTGVGGWLRIHRRGQNEARKRAVDVTYCVILDCFSPQEHRPPRASWGIHWPEKATTQQASRANATTAQQLWSACDILWVCTLYHIMCIIMCKSVLDCRRRARRSRGFLNPRSLQSEDEIFRVVNVEYLSIFICATVYRHTAGHGSNGSVNKLDLGRFMCHTSHGSEYD